MENPRLINDLNLDKGWRIGEENFREIVCQIKKVTPNVIVEFGAGASSIRLAQAFKQTKIYSIDHDIKYFRQAEHLKKITQNAGNLHLVFSPLKWQVHGLVMYESYTQVDLPKQIDAVIIDGPPHYTFDGREACLYQVYENLRIGGVVLLDDFDRVTEINHVAHWMAAYPGAFQQRSGGKNNSLCILIKIRHVPARLNRNLLITSYFRFFRRLYDGEHVMRIRKIYVRSKRWLKGCF